jgi:hypothetical protein
MAMALVQTPGLLYFVRFLIGAFEAGSAGSSTSPSTWPIGFQRQGERERWGPYLSPPISRERP